MPRTSSLVFAVLASIAAGCGGEAAPPPKVAPKPAAAAPAHQQGHLARGDVERVLRIGPYWVFHHVLHEPVVKDSGELVGWRITGLPEDWTEYGLEPGDIVTRVNGVAIVQPDDAWNAWKTAATAKELKIDLSRAGQMKSLAIPIDGAPSPDVVAALSNDSPPPRNPNNAKGTVVIEEEPPGPVDAE